MNFGNKFVPSLTSKTLTSLNKESRPFFLGDHSISEFSLGFHPLAITAFGGPDGHRNLEIIAFGAFELFFVSEKEMSTKCSVSTKVGWPTPTRLAEVSGPLVHTVFP